MEGLLAGTSRTFAAAMPLLDAPLREEITVAYLLFRIADTYEDAAAWPAPRRAEALSEFAQSLAATEGHVAPLTPLTPVAPLAPPPGFDDAHRELFQAYPAIAARLGSFEATHAHAIRKHVARTATGMRDFVTGSASSGVELTSLAELERYCYVVAGIVGELLTDLFVLAAPDLARARADLDRDAASFGEALQLVNILKDRDDDAGEGRRFLPADIPLEAVFARARHDCERAGAYVDALVRGGAPVGVIAFTRFPLRVARETLDALEKTGAGAKIGRARVLAILEEERALKT